MKINTKNYTLKVAPKGEPKSTTVITPKGHAKATWFQPLVYPHAKSRDALTKAQLTEYLTGGRSFMGYTSKGTRGYNLTMLRQGMPDKCLTTQALAASLDAAGYDPELAKLAGYDPKAKTLAGIPWEEAPKNWE